MKICFVSFPLDKNLKAQAELIDRYGNCSPEDADYIVALGGDGFILKSLHDYLKINKPIFGMNFGSVGFLMNKYSSKKIHPYGTDVSNKKMMLKFLSKINFFDSIKYFDFIIDDGSHIQSDQLIALNFFYKYVSNNGFYIIEDYKFPNYFKHLNDIDDIKINELIKKINNKETINSKLLSPETINDLLLNGRGGEIIKNIDHLKLYKKMIYCENNYKKILNKAKLAKKNLNKYLILKASNKFIIFLRDL